MIVRGVVARFDARRGDGVIRTDEGEELYFHCVALRDGTRDVEAGTRVVGVRRVGHLGRDEVGDIDKLDA